MKAIARRLAGVERRETARRVELGPPVLVIHPDDWPCEDRDAYDAVGAARDLETRRNLIERHAGRRPGPGTMVIKFRARADGPA